MGPTYSTPGGRTKTTENGCPKKSAHRCQQQHYVQQPKGGNGPNFQQWVRGSTKDGLSCPHHGRVFDHKKGPSTDTGSNTHEP